MRDRARPAAVAAPERGASGGGGGGEGGGERPARKAEVCDGEGAMCQRWPGAILAGIVNRSGIFVGKPARSHR